LPEDRQVDPGIHVPIPSQRQDGVETERREAQE
jgi:hypothetical protein